MMSKPGGHNSIEVLSQFKVCEIEYTKIGKTNNATKKHMLSEMLPDMNSSPSSKLQIDQAT
jgi:hypothetical protein